MVSVFAGCNLMGNGTFEGEVTYNTIYTLSNGNEAYHKDTMKAYLGRKYLVREHSRCSILGEKTDYYNFNSHVFYYTLVNDDSLHTKNVSHINCVFISTGLIKTNVTVMGYTCECYRILCKNKRQNQWYYIKTDYYFNRNCLKINKEDYSWIRASGFDKFINESGVFYLRVNHQIIKDSPNNNPSVTLEYEASKIEPKSMLGVYYSIDLKKLKKQQ